MNTNSEKIRRRISSQSTYHRILKGVTTYCGIVIPRPDFNSKQFKCLRQLSTFSSKSLTINYNSFVHDSSQEAAGRSIIKKLLHILDVNDFKLTLNRVSAQLAKHLSKIYQDVGKVVTSMQFHDIVRQQKVT